MALTGNEIIQAVAPDGAGHPAAVPLNISVANLLGSGLPTDNAANGLVSAGNNQATALALTKNYTVVATVASSTGVVLPAASIGQTIYVFNNGANVLQVYGNGSDTIDGVAGSTGVPLTNAKRCAYVCVAANTWISAQLGVVSA